MLTDYVKPKYSRKNIGIQYLNRTRIKEVPTGHTHV